MLSAIAKNRCAEPSEPPDLGVFRRITVCPIRMGLTTRVYIFPLEKGEYSYSF